MPRTKAERMAEILRARGLEEGASTKHRIEREIDELRERAERAEGQGRVEEAGELRERAERLAADLNHRREAGERQRMLGTLRDRLHALREKMERAEVEGRDEVLVSLRGQADILERELRERERHQEMEQLERERHVLPQEAERHQDQGHGDEGDRLRHEAEGIEGRLRDLAGGHEEGESNRVRRDDKSAQVLRNQVHELRQQVRELRRLLEEARERRN